MSAKRIVLIGGPTATGKSRFALDLAQRLDGMVINADSMQVYRELAVLTARPTPAEEASAPHRLYGVLSIAERCSAARWRALARAAIDEAWRGRKLPIVVGGTGLYFRALVHGLAPVPAVPEAARARALDLFERLGSVAFHARLAERDPAMARRLSPHDRQRLIRAFEVVEATGRSLADWQAEGGSERIGAGGVVAWRFEPPRAALYAACDARFDAMLRKGALDEVRALARLGLEGSLPGLKALGVRELKEHLEGGLSLAAAAEKARMRSRRYAKRQLTWFRHQWADAQVVSGLYEPALGAEAARALTRFRLTA